MSTTTTPHPKAYPLAPDDLTVTILDLIQKAYQYKSVKRGANEVTKALNKGKARVVVLSADATPLEILLHIPLLCEDKNVPYIFVPSRSALGRACGLSREVIAACLLVNDRNKSLSKQMDNLQDAIERIMV
eukprot:CAMPEP_0117442078 /NCGR_PEP_ID=MMETSP0759-20121206/3964_1 /TAXON_ID=63605 /ORGANISM="Percolomonas cosmopolitus, Strain WS" /LENGTH=130 /DNA_ID=CAMNT_0005233951 /DNA_START=147 /DNA_END=539 /DNA_ORIENTATION=-